MEIATAPVAGHAPHAQPTRLDRWGIALSGLCAIHCFLTPILLITAPVVGRVWSAPWVHAVVAAAVLPLAGWVLARGFRHHRKLWIAVAASLGMLLILGGLIAPWFASNPVGPVDASHAEGCCTKVVRDDEGRWDVDVTAGAILTALGSLGLIAAHLGNLRHTACRGC